MKTKNNIETTISQSSVLTDQAFSQHYSDEGFWKKLKNFAKPLGLSMIKRALTLYFAAKDPNTPTWTKTQIFGALGYLIVPIDAIPDLVPLIGFTDDLGIIGLTIATICPNIKHKHTLKAEKIAGEIFP